MARRTKELGPAIGLRLRQARKLSGLTIAELAERAHLSRKTVQDLSLGHGGAVGVGTITDLARALDVPGVTPAWLAFGEGTGPQQS